MRKLIKNSIRPVRKGIRRYNLHQHAWTDQTFRLVAFAGKYDPNSREDRDALWRGLNKLLGPTCKGNYPFGSSSWSIARVFTFSNSGVVVISDEYSIGD
jgi:hypothetical protein